MLVLNFEPMSVSHFNPIKVWNNKKDKGKYNPNRFLCFKHFKFGEKAFRCDDPSKCRFRPRMRQNVNLIDFGQESENLLNYSGN